MYEEKKGHLPFSKLQMHQLNPVYCIKNKKKDELSREQERELFSKLEKLQYDDERGIVQEETATRATVASSHYAAGECGGTSSASGEVEESAKKDTAVVAANPVPSE